MAATTAPPAIDPRFYRQVLGQYPTGVCVITSQIETGEAVAMVVGSFTSVSLDPPLVAFFPDRNSSSWAKLRGCDRFCVNVLSSEQEAACRRLASKDPDKFDGIAHRISENGSPILDGVVAWIECERHAISDAGDHEMVTGRILALDVASGELPLLFFQGGYGGFTPASLAVGEAQGLTLEQLRLVDKVRPAMERLADELGGQCIATVRIGRELAVAASAGQGRRHPGATLVGERLPFAPPTGAVHAAWLQRVERDRWLEQSSGRQAERAEALAAVRARGYSVGLLSQAQSEFANRLASRATGAAPSGQGSDLEELLQELAFDPATLDANTLTRVRLISVPVFDATGEVSVALTIHDFGRPAAGGGIPHYVEQMRSTAAALTGELGGRPPNDEEGAARA